MNYFDIYDAPADSTNSHSQQSLNEEVADVIGQFGRFWGAFRKQSQTALEIAKRDIGDVVNQAQQELSKLTTSDSTSQATPTGTVEGEETTSTTEGENQTPTTPVAESSTSAPTTLFGRLQSAIPPNIASTVRSHLPKALQDASENIDFGQLQSNVMSELQRVQGITRAQAEEYVHKSEALLREAVREAGVVLREAVKVVPPEEAAGASYSSGVVWDGTDIWTLPSSTSEDLTATDRAEPSSARQDTQRAVATRAEALLRRLKHDPSIIRHDPQSDETLGDYFDKWLAQEIDAKGGIDGSLWTERRNALLAEPEDGHALQEMIDMLVSSEMTDTVFWQRFLFRTHQITQEEERRKALIESTNAEAEDDLSWGEEEEEETAGSLRTIAAPRLGEGSREGSDASYDVVSTTTSGVEAEESDGWE
ncbi:hypothetical protein JOM56_002459 [Amanita muscaria]